MAFLVGMDERKAGKERKRQAIECWEEGGGGLLVGPLRGVFFGVVKVDGFLVGGEEREAGGKEEAVSYYMPEFIAMGKNRRRPRIVH